MKFLALAAIATSTVAVASAATAAANATTFDLLDITAPIASTIWNSNSTNAAQNKAVISWSNDCSGLANTTLPVVLNLQVNGLQVEQTKYGTIGYIDCAEKGSVTLASIPLVDMSSNLYSILVRNGNLSYSALFTIINPALPNINQTAAATTLLPTTTATTTTAAPTTTPTVASGAGALKVGSTAALVVLAIVGLMF